MAGGIQFPPAETSTQREQPVSSESSNNVFTGPDAQNQINCTVTKHALNSWCICTPEYYIRPSGHRT